MPGIGITLIPNEATCLFDRAKVDVEGQIGIIRIDRVKALENITGHPDVFKDRGDQAAIVMAADAFQGIQREGITQGITAVPVVPDNVEPRLARMNRHITTTSVIQETAANEQP